MHYTKRREIKLCSRSGAMLDSRAGALRFHYDRANASRGPAS